MTATEPYTQIVAAGACVGFQGDEGWTIRTICQQSHLDVAPTECTILSVHGADAGMRYVMAVGGIIGSYRVYRDGFPR